MGHASAFEFRTFHSLRIKGFAPVDTLAEMTTLADSDVSEHLDDLEGEGYARFRDRQAMWQITPDGREAHIEQLAVDVDLAGDIGPLAPAYSDFLEHNEALKSLCGEWQLRDGAPNDHSDSDYDAAVVDGVGELHDRAQPSVAVMGDVFDRLSPYLARLTAVLGRFRGGESNMFTGVMCGSYHDVWMELHEDLLLTQRIDRAQEGSF